MKYIVAAAVILCIAFAGSPAFGQIRADDVQTRQVGALHFHYPSRAESAVERLARIGPMVVEDLKSTLALEEFPPVDVWVLSRLSDYYVLHGLDRQPPSWAIGLSLTNQRTILLLNGANPQGGGLVNLEATMRHELGHVAVDQIRKGNPVPLWFNEGVAIMVADEWTAERSDMLARAASRGNLVPFSEMDRHYPQFHNQTSLSYAQAFHFVRWLRYRHGPDVVARILHRVGEGQAFEEAFYGQTQRSVALTESIWRQELEESTTFWSVLMDGMLIFFGATLLFIVAWWLRRRRKIVGMAAMARDDAPGDWDYDESRYPLPGDPRR